MLDRPLIFDIGFLSPVPPPCEWAPLCGSCFEPGRLRWWHDLIHRRSFLEIEAGESLFRQRFLLTPDGIEIDGHADYVIILRPGAQRWELLTGDQNPDASQLTLARGMLVDCVNDLFADRDAACAPSL